MDKFQTDKRYKYHAGDLLELVPSGKVRPARKRKGRVKNNIIGIYTTTPLLPKGIII